MDTICFNKHCTYLVTNKLTCESCNGPRYCSIECKDNHIKEEHQYVCPANSDPLKLDDFEDTGIEIGKGSYGRVSLIRHKLSKCLYALKRISKLSLHQNNQIEIARNEISVQKTLNHPNIIRLIAHIEDSARIYLILEYAEYGDLSTYKENSENSVWKYFTQTCSAVKYLHSRNIIHRDIKLSNLLMGKCIKLCDFGWSIHTEKPSNTICGTLDYMAPELIAGVNYNKKVDIWALGVLLYELFHGSPPFKGDNESEKCSNILRAKFDLSPGIPEEARDLIKQMLAKRHPDRIDIDQVLQHPWVARKVSVAPLCLVDHVKHQKYGLGCIDRFSGCLCFIRFQELEISFCSSDVLWETTQENELKEQSSLKVKARHARSRTGMTGKRIELTSGVLNQRKEELEAISTHIEGKSKIDRSRRQSWYQNLFGWLK